MKIRYSGKYAFTLVELLVVVAIISILALIALPTFEDAQTRSKVSAVKNNMRSEALKLEMLQVDTNRYPLAGKWHRLILWRVLTGEEDDPNAEFIKRMRPLYGPHWDIFEWEALKRNALQDTIWVGNQNDFYIYNGFGFFSPPTMVEALEWCVDWEGADVSHWEAAVERAGDWMLVSPGPDLTSETPAWIACPCAPWRTDLREEGYNERALFTEYDPTNGTVSYGNIFRTQRDAGGLHADAKFYDGFREPAQ